MSIVGIRLHELCNIKVKDVDFKNMTVYIEGKGGRLSYRPILTSEISFVKDLIKNKGKEEKEREQFESNKKSINEELSIAECTLKLKEYSVVDSTSYEDTKSIAIVFDYTNNSEVDSLFCNYVNNGDLTLYQDGILLKIDGLSKLVKEHTTVIKPGTTIEVVYVFDLENETSDVEVELKHYDQEKSTCKIKLK